MNRLFASLEDCILFKNISGEDIESLMKSIDYTVKTFEKNEFIGIQGQACGALGIIAEGSLEIHKPFPSGKVVTINHFTVGNIFGEAILFSKENNYPANVVSSSHTRIIFIDKVNLVSLMGLNNTIIENFMSVLSNRILMLNNRITDLSYDTLRKKLASMIILEYSRQKSNYIVLPYSRVKWAEFLNVSRSSLSRELVNMKNDGIIDFYKNKIKILDLEALEAVLI